MIRLALALALSAGAAAAGAAPPVPAGEPPLARALENAPARTLDDAAWVSAADLARLLSATKFWRSDIRKLVLRCGPHQVVLTVDNPFVLIDDRVVRLEAPVRSIGGEVLAPAALVDSLPRDTSIARLVYDPRSRRVLQIPSAGVVGSPRVSAEGREDRVVFPADRPEEAAIVGRGRAHFKIHLGGFFLGTLPDSISAPGLVQGARFIPSAAGCAFELAIAPEAQGYRLIQDVAGRRVLLVVARDAHGDLEPFAPEGPPGSRAVRVIVLDPGHGGSDLGVTVDGLEEKDLALALALKLKPVLERRLASRVILTRGDDRALAVEERAELANRAHADLVVGLHFDGFPGGEARGVTAYCPPATVGSAGGGEPAVQAWRDVAARHAVLARELGESLLASFELRNLGPTRLREILPYTLVGVNAPGLLLECGTLTAVAERARLAAPGGMDRLVDAITAGIEAYGKGR